LWYTRPASGYFDDPQDDRRVLQNIFRNLKPHEMHLIDMLGIVAADAGAVHSRDLLPCPDSVTMVDSGQALPVSLFWLTWMRRLGKAIAITGTWYCY
jgi:hypothetical protein